MDIYICVCARAGCGATFAENLIVNYGEVNRQSDFPTVKQESHGVWRYVCHTACDVSYMR